MKRTVKVMVVSGRTSLMNPFARLFGEATGIEVCVETHQKHDSIGSLVELHARWKQQPDLYDALLVGWPVTDVVGNFFRDRTPEAEAIGDGFNVVVRRPGETLSLFGHDSRCQALFTTLERAGVKPQAKKRALVIGDKSASAVGARACKNLSVKEIHVLNGSARGVYTMKDVVGLQEPDGKYDLIINTVPSPGLNMPAPVSAEVFDKQCLVVDLIYNPTLQTSLLQQAEDHGCSTINGAHPAALRAAFGLQQLTNAFPQDLDAFLMNAEAIAELRFGEMAASA